MSHDFYLGCAVGWALGGGAMWVYFAKFSGLLKTREEYNAATEGEKGNSNE